MKRTVVIIISIVVIAVLVFLGYQYIWSGVSPLPENPDPTVKLEYVDASEIDVSKVFINANSNFAISNAGRVYTWGYNATGVLGMGDRNDRMIPTPITGLDGLDVIKISKGYSYVIALTSDGSLYGWGVKEQTLLGATNFPVLEPIKLNVSVPDKIVDVATGQDHVIVLTDTGRLFTWGEGNYGNLGTGVTFFVAEEPVEIQAFSSSPIVQIVSDTFTSAAITEAGEVFLWGIDHYSQETQEYLKEPTKIEALADVHAVQVSLGRCIAVLTSDGKIYTWGQNLFGECGAGNKDTQYEPQLVVGLEEEYIIQVSAGSSHTLALAQSGKVYAWGYNDRGQVGVQISQSIFDRFFVVPTEIAALGDKSIGQVFAGSEYSIAVAWDGSVYTWGYGTNGQLGRGDENNNTIIPTPTQIERYVK